VEKIRVLVANRPRLMRELVLATVSDQADIEVMGEIKEDSEIASVVEEYLPDFVIIALDRPGERPELCRDLLRRHPQLRILALAPEQNSSMVFWAVVDIRSGQIESSEAGILDALRSKVQRVEQQLNN
jgi:two-component system, NarL family, response regulator DegU